jgi:cobalamin biosynthesis protein CobT
MSGRKITHAGIATALLNHSLGNLLRIPTMIFGFSGDNTCDHYVFRTFSEKLVPEEKFMDRFATGVNRAMRQNLDGEAVLWGYKHLTTTRNKRKVLIVLSDGQPAAMRSGDSGAYLKQVTAAIEADPKVDLYGIGLMDTSVTRYYKHHSVILSAGDLEHRLISVIQSKII